MKENKYLSALILQFLHAQTSIRPNRYTALSVGDTYATIRFIL
jgi:hypothetical protein